MGLLPLTLFSASAQYADIRVHDPTMIKQDGTYYLFSTGAGISVYTSTNLAEWEESLQIFEQKPEWSDQVVPDFGNHIWAPDINYHEGVYYLYYSVSSFGRNTSAIGVATNTTLDADDPAYEWVDQGPVVRSVPGRDLWNAIDPNLAFDDEGTPWMTFGSFWQGIKLVQLGESLTEIAQPERWYTIASRERSWTTDDRYAGEAAIEAPFIFKKDGWYYLFVSWDHCCRGTESTYRIMVGRSEEMTGPYLDREGQEMRQGGGTLVLEGNDRWSAVGHNSAYTFGETDYLVFHGYDATDEGRPKLLIREMDWDNDGWPVVALDS